MIVDLMEPDYHYEKIINISKSLAKEYDKLLNCVTIGASHDNRDIVLLKLGIGQKYLICCSGIHGREIVNPVVLLRIIEYYAELYTNHKAQKARFMQMLSHPNQYLKEEYEQMLYGACIYELLQTYTLLMIPLLNPDGYMIALNGFDMIHNTQLRRQCIEQQVPYQEWKANARGVDLNRNFPCLLWKPKWEGDTPASENETKILIQLFHDYRSRGFLDLHSRGKGIYYYRSTMPEGYNLKQREMADRLSALTGYALYPPEEEIETGDSGGNTVHYYAEHFRKPAFTVESVAEEADFPLADQYRITTFEELRLIISEFGSMIIS